MNDRSTLGLLLACTAMALAARPAAAASTVPATTAHPLPVAASLDASAPEVRRVAHWVLDSGDNAGLPFLLVDKAHAQVFVFSAAGELRGTAPALLGMARGDRLLAPNSATMAQMRPQERITPAGRFLSKLAIDSDGKQLLVLDYAASISLHPVIKGTPEERRAERLKSATSQDNRISYGCINVPVGFYATIISPTFTNTRGVVYVLPETMPPDALFGMNNASRGGKSSSTAFSAGPTAANAAP